MPTHSEIYSLFTVTKMYIRDGTHWFLEMRRERRKNGRNAPWSQSGRLARPVKAVGFKVLRAENVRILRLPAIPPNSTLPCVTQRLVFRKPAVPHAQNRLFNFYSPAEKC